MRRWRSTSASLGQLSISDVAAAAAVDDAPADLDRALACGCRLTSGDVGAEAQAVVSDFGFKTDRVTEPAGEPNGSIASAASGGGAPPPAMSGTTFALVLRLASVARSHARPAAGGMAPLREPPLRRQAWHRGTRSRRLRERAVTAPARRRQRGAPRRCRETGRTPLLCAGPRRPPTAPPALPARPPSSRSQRRRGAARRRARPRRRRSRTRPRQS
eukprot:9850-Chlamydomonas_euryale.AAC.1